MKNFKFKIVSSFLVVVALLAGILSSCTEDDGSQEGSKSLVIESVSKTAVNPANGETPETVIDSATTLGFAGQTFIIRGKGFATLEKIYFNDFDTYFNPTFVTDEVIFVTVDRNTPYANVSNKLKLVTKYATASYDFVVGPPAPKLDSFNAVNATAGQEVTIYGSFFLDPIVTVGATTVPVISSTLNEITIALPADSHNKYITVKTIAGASTSVEAIGTAIYDDAFYGAWAVQPWQTNFSLETDNTARQGKKYIKTTMDGWGSLQLEWTWDDQISAYAGIRLSLKADNPGKIQFIFNGNWSDTAPSLDVTDKWQDYFISWEQLGGNVTQVQNITFKNNIGDSNVYYIDNIGYYLN